MDNDEEEMSSRNLRALTAALRDYDDDDGELMRRDSLSDDADTRGLTLGSQLDSAPLFSPPLPPSKRPRQEQKSKCSNISGRKLQAVNYLPDIVASQSGLRDTFLPSMDVDPHSLCSPQPAKKPQKICPEEQIWTKIQYTTLEGSQEAGIERISSATVGFVSHVPQPEVSGNENEMCDDILGHASFRIDEESLFGAEYFWDYHEVDNSFQLPRLPGQLQQEEDGEEEEEEEEVEHHGELYEQHTTADDQGALLYPGASINVLESLASILSFVQSEHISGMGLRRLLSLIYLHLPQPNNFFKTNHAVFKMLESLDEPVHIHHYCSACYQTRISLTDLCDTCTDESRYVHYFMTVPVVSQLSRLLKRPDFVHSLQHKLTRSKQNPNNIEDIYDGEIYKQVEAQTFNNSGISISLMWNTDGVQIFTSNTYSLWPVYLVVNELPPEKRFLSENLLIAGLWGSLVKPHPNVYLLPIYKYLVPLQNGVEMEVFGETEKQKVYAKVICGTCDAPATAMFMNIKSHSGFYSCPVCTIKGEKPGDATVFPFVDNVPLRDMESYRNHVKLAVENRVILTSNLRNEERFCGVKGPTILSNILENMFASMAIDSLHCLYLGCMKQLLRLWFDKDFKHQPFSSHGKMPTLTERLLSLAPPHFIQRSHQPVEKLVHWKGTEFRSFLFYVSAILMQDVLQPHVFNHFALFVKGVAALNSSSISLSDITSAGSLLEQFVKEFESIYGVDNVSHNVHMCIHLHDVVQRLGPLWATSCFQFEDMNGRLKNMIHGTRHVGIQIQSKLSLITHLPLMVGNLREGPAKTYCQDLRKKYKLRTFDSISSCIYCVGSLSDVSIDYSWILVLLRDRGVLNPNSKTQLFHRLLKDRLLYVSSNYKQGARNSSYCKYKAEDGWKYGNVQCFVKVSCTCAEKCSCSYQSPKYLTIIKPVPVVQFQTESITFNHIFKFDPTHVQDEFFNVDVVNIYDLHTVMYKIDCSGIMYLSEPLNHFELE
ncbi:Zinc finger protein 438 [Frankliniella fusca]|uniref:Zinc finger protein 438 n=1 Tax=Frankliniella fusca TaxID=407009 RepID=A0AAE1I0J0_9NEOP|nr:Zinc finger protein 438 [Frankliniella fusca]KAK3930641.1 Zinc finger protein 438 [Frankliniella fusca]